MTNPVFRVKLHVKSINMSTFVKRGMMMYNREALPFDDPDHPYQYIKGLGLVPEEFGYFRPLEIDMSFFHRSEFG